MAASITDLAKSLVLGVVVLSCASGPRPAPYSAAEVDQALAGVKKLQASCYASSEAARANRKATFEFSLQVLASGQVRSVPTFADPEEPELIECLRHGLDEVRFPARARDRLDLHFELAPPSASPAAQASRVAHPSPV